MHKIVKVREYYISLRDSYLPEELRLVMIAESPPASGKYFYDPNGMVSEQLFRAVMLDILHVSPVSKIEGLKLFRDAGMFLMDATYTPVNKGLSSNQRDRVILDSYPDLKRNLTRVIGGRDVSILLIKANVCELLEPLLVKDKFRVLNRGRKVPFPGFGQQGRFREVIREILESWKA